MIDFTHCEVNKFLINRGDFRRLPFLIHQNTPVPVVTVKVPQQRVHKDCNQALERISARIDMARIETIIQQTPGLLPVQRDFYGIMIRARKEQILDCGMEQLLRVREQRLDGPPVYLNPFQKAVCQ